jgi:DNA polymerase I-like protein with 3'-5' exonuclease and polymerase domains
MTDQFPDVRGADLISIDCETYDPDLLEKGCGATRDGYIVGVAVATRHTAHYYPVAHEGGGNMDRQQVFKYLRDMLTTDVPKTGANLQYDLSYLWTEGVQVQGPFYDVQIAEPLLDENRGVYNLESLAQVRLGKGKDEEEMNAYIRQHFHAKPGKEKSFIWKCPAHIVAPYAKEDVRLPIEILDQQLVELKKEKMLDLWQMESDLLPILTRMHLNGVRVDATYADQLKIEWGAKIAELEKLTKGINARSGKQIASYLDEIGFEYPTTAKGNPSIKGKWLEANAEKVDIFAPMVELKKYKHFLGTFINGYIIESNVNGRVHGQFNQLKGDEYGTVTGRLSASKPNLQNIPNPEKDPFFSQKCRGMFLPERGCEWLRYDFSQIEYRLLVHFASGLPGGVADIARQMYIDNPDQDFHQFCAQVTGLDIKYGPKLGRKYAKNINFGLIYGMGIKKLTASLGIPTSEAKTIFATYHAKAPFAKAFMDAAMQRASNRGYIRTIGRRKRRFDSWESTKFIRQEDKIDGEIYTMRNKQAAIDRWGPVKRAHTHAAANAVLQGSSADMTKKSMVEGYKRGIYDVIGFPHVTVHDELGFSIETGNPRHEEAAREMQEIMENAYKLVVPVLVSVGRGANWGLAA